MRNGLLVISVVLLCFFSFVLGQRGAGRQKADIVESNVQFMAMWREQDWQLASIRYAEIIRLMQARQNPAAIQLACQEISRNLQRLRSLEAVLERPKGSQKVPISVRETYSSTCSGKSTSDQGVLP